MNPIMDLFLGGGQDLVNAFAQWRENDRTEANTNRANDLLTQYDTENYWSLDPYTYNFGSFDAGNQAAHGDPLMMDRSRQSAEEKWNSYYKPFDFSGLDERITKMMAAGNSDLSGAVRDPNQAAADVGRFYDQAPINTNAYVSDALRRSGGASMQRTAQGRSGILSRGLASGMSLQDLSGDLAGLGYSEGMARGADASVAGAQAEASRNAAALQKAGSQSQAYDVYGGYAADLAGKQAGIKADLAKGAADNLLTSGKYQAEVGLDAAKTGTAAGQFDIQAARDEIDKMFGRGQQSYEFAARVKQLLAELHQQSAGLQSSNITGQQFLVPQTNAIGNTLQMQAAIDAAKASQSKQNPFNVTTEFML